MLRNMSLLNVRLPRLLPRVECIAALMACIAIDKASLMYSLELLCDINNVYSNNILNGLQIVLIFGVSHILIFFAVTMSLGHFLPFGAFFCTWH
jgi:hypothetical protein